MSALRRALPVVFAAVSIGACDRNGEITIYPEVEETWGFESGLEGWDPAAADAGTTAWSVVSTDGAASRGSGSVEFAFEGAGPPAKVWIERSFALDSLRGYDVTVEYDLGSRDGGTDAPWQVVAGASGGPLTSADMAARASTVGEAGGGLHWVHQTHTFIATSGPEGELVFGLGIAPASVGSRTYWLDDVRVTLMRR